MMTGLIGMSVVAIGLALTAFFMLPEAHKASGTLAIGGACVLGVALLVKTTLPFIPWVGGAMLLVGVCWTIYRLKKGKSVLPDLNGDGKPL